MGSGFRVVTLASPTFFVERRRDSSELWSQRIRRRSNKDQIGRWLMRIPAQCRAGRALLEWSQADLAHASHLGLSTIRDFEKGRRVPSHNNLAGIRRALEEAGVNFIDENGGGPGARLLK